MRIIPAIDIIDGKCVRLSKGDYATKKIYNENPLEVAKEFEAHGIRYLHLVDLDGAKSKHIVNHGILEQIASKTNLKIDFGGGLKADDDLRIAFECGANQITGGSIAVKDKETFSRWIVSYGAEKIILGADVLNGKIAVSGWQEDSAWELDAFLRQYIEKDVKYVISTDVSKDGVLQGPATDLYGVLFAFARTDADLYGDMVKKFPDLEVIASGGVSGMKDIYELDKLPLHGVIVGKAIYENRISLKEIEGFVSGG